MAFSLAHLANIDTLKSIEASSLQTLLQNGGLPIPFDKDNQIDFKALAAALLEPEKIPEALANALFYINALATSKGADELQTFAEIVGLNIHCAGEDVSPADYVLRVWQQRPDLVKRALAESTVENIQAMESYYGKPAKALKMITQKQCDRIAADMDIWFSAKRRGTGTEISSFEKHGHIWLVVRRGNAFRRETLINQKTKASEASFGYPETHDILIYDPLHNELRSHADGVAIKKQYRRVLGAVLFNDGTHFTLGEKYTLVPLLKGKKNALRLVKGIESARLTQIEFPMGNIQNEVIKHTSDNVLASFAERDASTGNAASISWDTIPSLSSATIKVHLGMVDGIEIGERSIRIIPPNRALFKRDAATPIIEEFLERNEYVLGPPEVEVAPEDS